MKINKIIYALAIGLGISAAAWAVPAKRGPIEIVNEQGETEIVYLFGDEHLHWTGTTPDAVCPLPEETITERRAMRAPAATQTATERNIAPRGLVILVNFADLAFSKADHAEMDSMLNGENYTREYKYGGKTYRSEGSARRYFQDQSAGQYNPVFDVVGPYTVANGYKYYGENDYSGNDQHADEMIVEACRIADEEGVDFTQYDHNNDGYVDFVYVIYAGYGEADGGGANKIWPHTYWISQTSYKNELFDGLKLNTYACANEIIFSTKQHCGIGTFCHEFSHVLGLPDLYKTNNGSHKTMGEWDIMDYGPYNNDGNTPPAYSSYERFFMGWLEPELLDTLPRTVVLDDLKDTNKAYIITETDASNLVGNDPSPTTFWMLENRQQVGWDQYIPGSGLMLTKIKYAYSKWNQNTVNNTKSNMGVDLVEADGSAPNYSDGKPGDLFPAGATSYSGIPNHEISDVTMTNGIITFAINGGSPDGVQSAEGEVQSVKCLMDGQIVIIRGDKMYSITGLEITGKR